MNCAPTLELLLSDLYASAPSVAEHRDDLRRSGLSDETVQRHKLRSVPPAMFDGLLGFRVPAGIRSMMLIPYPDPSGGWMDHVRVKVFPPLPNEVGTLKYLQPRGSGSRLFFPLATLADALDGTMPLWCVEGEKKGLPSPSVIYPLSASPGSRTGTVHAPLSCSMTLRSSTCLDASSSCCRTAIFGRIQRSTARFIGLPMPFAVPVRGPNFVVFRRLYERTSEEDQRGRCG
jgi:hypothetical protein